MIVPLGNGEPVTLLDAIEAHAAELGEVRVHQMHALHDRPYLHGAHPSLRHVSYFLSHVTRPCFHAGTIDLVPNNFSEMRDVLTRATRDPLVIAGASPPDRHGYFSLGVSADYVSSMIGRARIFLEANARMPRTFGRNQIHISQVVGWSRADYPLIEVPPVAMSEEDRRIGALVAERVPDGATLQVGIGGIPNAILEQLRDHRDLGVHTELIADGIAELVERGVVTGVRKQLNRTKTVATFALGTQWLYDFLDENTAVELWPVRYVNDPRIIGTERGFVSINATLAVDLLGQCASETLGRLVLVVERWAGGLRPRGDVLRGRAGIRRAALVGQGRHGVAHRRPARRRRRGDDDQEHRRQGGHRARRGRAARPLDPPAGRGADRHRPPDHRDDLRAAGRRLGYL